MDTTAQNTTDVSVFMFLSVRNALCAFGLYRWAKFG